MRNESKPLLRILAYCLIGFATVMALSVIIMLATGARPTGIHVAPLITAAGGLLLLRHTKRKS
jgi:hypothetical protein